MSLRKQMSEVSDPYGFTWVYNCGWRIKGTHPYRPASNLIDLEQPIGIFAFFKETGILPKTKLRKKPSDDPTQI